jgi:cyclic pyranopterin phosphate synthase
MSEDMVFLPRKDLLSLEEIDRIARAFIRRGVDKIRVTGGEPLVRKGIMDVFRSLAPLLAEGALRELTLTTNGTQLARRAEELARAGVRRVNVSLDSLDPTRFAAITRSRSLDLVLSGIEAARAAGLAVKLNVVALQGVETEIDELMKFAHGRDMTLTLIETMPLGEVGADRVDQYLPLTKLRRDLERRWTLVDVPMRSGGPAHYVHVAQTGGKIGFIAPMTHNFCEECNRVRVTASGILHTCLGQEDSIDLRTVLRRSESDEPLMAAIDRAILDKPRGHDFIIERDRPPALARHMSATGG